jgi:negative regulator of flagellin synthesis FlgM
MKIGPQESRPVAPAAGERPPGAAEAAGPRGAATTGSPVEAAAPAARVEVSTTAELLARAAAEPPFDAEKVERIAQAIRDGTFQIDAGKIADRLLQNARDLLGPAGR